MSIFGIFTYILLHQSLIPQQLIQKYALPKTEHTQQLMLKVWYFVFFASNITHSCSAATAAVFPSNQLQQKHRRGSLVVPLVQRDLHCKRTTSIYCSYIQYIQELKVVSGQNRELNLQLDTPTHLGHLKTILITPKHWICVNLSLSRKTPIFYKKLGVLLTLNVSKGYFCVCFTNENTANVVIYYSLWLYVFSYITILTKEIIYFFPQLTQCTKNR